MAKRMKIWLRAATAAVIAGAFFALCAAAAFAQTENTVEVPGLQKKATIRRDAYGVPHIQAENPEDALFAQGYAMAEDRFLQMDLMRRISQGRLSELAGMLVMSIDEKFRVFDFRRLAEKQLSQSTPEMNRLIERFGDGVNQYVFAHKKEIAPQYGPFASKPAPWEPADSLTIYYLISWGLAESYTEELLAEKLLEAIGKEKLELLLNSHLDDETIITASAPENRGLYRKARSSRESLNPFLEDPSQIRGSNNWAVDGAMTKSGKPLLANDPHLTLTTPSIWWESHIKTPELESWGSSIPGTPGHAIGFNRRLAWAITNFGGDVQDLFIEKLNPDNSARYEFKGEWRDMEVFEDKIRYKSGKSFGSKKFTHYRTRHGPIIENKDGRALALAWTAYDPGDELSAFFSLASAKSVSEGVEALRKFGSPPLNFVFADADGNIAYYCGGKIPIRPKGDGSLPVPGWTGEYDWQGYVPFERMPHLINPDRHFVATANNKAEPSGGAYNFGNEWSWAIGYRAHRITDRLKALAPHDIESFKAIQADVYSLFAEDFMPILLANAGESALNGLEPPLQEAGQRALEALRGWDYRASKDSLASAIFHQWFTELIAIVFEDDLKGVDVYAGDLQASEFSSGHFAQNTAIQLLAEFNGTASAKWIDDQTTPDVVETPKDVAAAAFRNALKTLTEKFGSDIAGWEWGKLHQVKFENYLERLGMAEGVGPFPNDGAPYTVDVGPYYLKKPFDQNFGPSFRMIVEMTDPIRAVMVNAPGESGIDGAPHYSDQMGLWLENDYRPMLTEESQIAADTKETTVLQPRP